MIPSDTQLGKYRIQRPIGKGGMADVYLAKDTLLGRLVAIKVLPPEMAQNTEWLNRFKQEVLATANLFHPNIVTVYDVGHEQGIHFYAMEYLPNGDLKQRITAGLTPYQALSYLKQIAQALEYAHQKGFIHRDIKPENVLFDEQDHPKLTDLGIAKAKKESQLITNARQSVGTPSYISPEQAQGKVVDERSDIYSLGIVFYEMLTGSLPYDDPEPLKIALQHIKGPLPQLPPHLINYQDFLTAMIAKDPADRFASASELLEAIELIEQNRDFSLDEFYLSRIERQADILNFEGISKSLDDTEPRTQLGAISILIVALLSLLFWQGENLTAAISGWYHSRFSHTPSTETPAQSATGVIKINSKPQGASVYLNGKAVGTTPYLGQNIPAGQHQITLTHPWFADYTGSISVIDSQITEESIELKPGSGDLKIQSQPSGAQIILDGKPLHQSTPFVAEKLTSGPHQLMLVKDHLAAEQEVVVEHAKQKPITVELKPGLMAYYPNRWIPIKQLYVHAQQLIDQGQLSSPTGNNAEEAYRAILKADPEQTKAQEKLIELGWKHWEKAESAASKKDIKATERHLQHSRRLLKQLYSKKKAQLILAKAKQK
jgi:serine/threonine protein kinase